MVATALGRDQVEPADAGCWCCGDRTVVASLLWLDGHPEVGVCFRCVGWLNKRKRAIERMTCHAPSGPWWRRVQYRGRVQPMLQSRP